MSHFTEKIERKMLKLDIFFNTKNAREKMMIFLMPFIVFGFLSYQYVYPYVKVEHKKITTNLKIMKQKVSTYKELLAVQGFSRQDYLKKQTKENEELKRKIKQTNDLVEYIDFKLSNITFLSENQDNWSNFLDTIVKKAKKNSLNIDYFANSEIKDVNSTSKFVPILSVELNGTNNFNGTFSFIKDIENSNFINEVEKAEIISLPSGLVSTLKIKLWGLKK
jgi:hypothetical protein